MNLFQKFLIIFSLLIIVVSKKQVNDAFNKEDKNNNCPAHAQLNKDQKLFPKTIEASPKSSNSMPAKKAYNLAVESSKIILTETYPKFAISLSDIETNNGLSICLENIMNGTLEFFIPQILNLDNYNLYDSGDLNNLIGPLSEIPTIDDNYKSYNNTISESGCFTIFNTGDMYEKNAVLFRWKEAQTKNCMNGDNILIAININKPIWNTFKASSEGNCEIIVLANPSMIPNIKINSFGINSEEDMVFKSALNDKILFETNSTDIIEWISILIYTPAMAILLPAETTLSIYCSDGLAQFQQPIINVCVDEQKGIIAPASYSGTNLMIESQSLYVFENEYNYQLSTAFFVKEINGYVNVQIQADSPGDSYMFSKADLGKTVTLKGNNLKVSYQVFDPKNDYFLFEYVIFWEINTSTSPTITAATNNVENTTPIYLGEGTKKIICNGDQAFYLPSDELFFIETPNFPKPSSACSMKFIVTNVQNNENLRMIFAITNYVGDIFDGNIYTKNDTYPGHTNVFPYFLSISNYEEIIFTTSSVFQGLIIAETSGSLGCPLTSITNINPYLFIDETQIIFLSSTYEENLGDTTPRNMSYSHCNWRFVAPHGYTFKVLIINFLVSNGTLTATNQFGQKFNIKDTFKPYYSDESYITFHFETKNLYNWFVGYLTIVKKVADLIDGNCSIINYTNGTTVWATTDDYRNKLYLNNAKCTFNLSVPLKNQMVADIFFFSVEKNVDSLHFFMSDKLVEVNQGLFSESDWKLYLQAHENGYNDKILWEFISDGSIQKYGFKVIFSEQKCQCAHTKIIVPCSEWGIGFNIMGDENDFYCGNLRCNINMTLDSSCQEKFINIYFKAFGNDFENDIARLHSNNQILLNNLLFYDQSNILISSLNENILEFISLPPLNYQKRKFYLLLNAANATSTGNVTLTKANPSYALPFSKIGLLTLFNVKLDDEYFFGNYFIEVFCHNFNGLIFYDNENLTNILLNGNGLPKDQSFTFNKSLTVYGDPTAFGDPNDFANADLILYFRVTKEHNKNCFFKNNVALISFKPSKTFTMVANGNGYCPFILLNSFVESTNSLRHIFSEIWSSSKNQTSKIYAGKNDRFLVEFNIKKTWNKIYMQSNFYTILIPPNSSIKLKFAIFDHDTSEINSTPYRELWVSPNYDREIHQTTTYLTNFVSYYRIKDNVALRFTVLDFNVTFDTLVQVNVANTNKTLANFTYLGQQFNITNPYIQLQFVKTNDTEPEIEYNRVLLGIEAVDRK